MAAVWLYIACMLDVDFYRKLYPDLRRMTPEQARKHYHKHGIAEGRQACAQGSRGGIIEVLSRYTRVLEIGPFDRPLVSGPGVKYADYFRREELKERALLHSLNPDGVPYIHYVLSRMALEDIPLRFEVVVSSHCIEHQPDLVRHLQVVEQLLEPDGQAVFLIPDKRYCFDHFLAESTLAEVLGAYVRRAKVHDAVSIIEQRMLTAHNDSPRHWKGDHGLRRFEEVGLDPVRDALRHFEAEPDTYLDAHAWQFTPQSFAMLVGQLNELGLIRLAVGQLHHTLRNSNEFIAVLERPRATASP
jgi:SAM-dependent methyltransferase